MCYSARVFRSEEAFEAGLVRSLHDPKDLIPAAREQAREFVSSSSSVVKTVLRHMVWRMLGAPHPIDAHRVDTADINQLATSPDAKEGINVFREKRAPNFPDRVSRDLPDFFPWWEEPEFQESKVGRSVWTFPQLPD